MHWQATREHSRVELVDKLKTQGFEESIISQVLDELGEEGLQSDRRFLETLVRSRYAKGHGSDRIRLELRQHGIGDEALNQCLTEYNWDALLEKIHRKKYGEAQPATPKEYSARLRFLSQRGFEHDRIQAFLRHLRRGDH